MLVVHFMYRTVYSLRPISVRVSELYSVFEYKYIQQNDRLAKRVQNDDRLRIKLCV